MKVDYLYNRLYYIFLQKVLSTIFIFANKPEDEKKHRYTK